jgi:glycosyltransferase involved in cell wall biosynthesis
MELSVVLPAYNECNRLEASVDRLDAYLNKAFSQYEIIIVEDSSTDGSLEAASRARAAHDNVILIHNDIRLGRGASLKEAIIQSSANYVIYMDVDLATDLVYIKNLVDGLKSGASVSTGSRLMKGSKVSRPAGRDIASKSYNLLIRLLFGSKIHDHQCGFKGFNKKSILPVLDLVQDDHWFWDTELLVICQNFGLAICEFPVDWRHNGGNNLNASKVRLAKDTAFMGKRLIMLKARMISRSIGHTAQSVTGDKKTGQT